MNMSALFDIVGLRYRLLWARARSSRGRLVLLLGAYLLVFPLVIFLYTGGIASGLAAVRSGKAGLVAATVLGSIYLDAALITLLLGSGTSPAFADSELRRYPLSRLERAAARELTAFFDPIWLLVLALDLGLAVGFHRLRAASSLWFAIPAVLLLLVSNFLLARIASVAADRVASSRIWPLLLAVIFPLGIVALPIFSNLGHSGQIWKNGLFPVAISILKITPPFAAATAMTEVSAFTAIYSLVELLCWCFLFAALLTVSEQLPHPPHGALGARTTWVGPCDRIAAPFGASAPLVSKTLRYHLRCNRVRITYALALLMFPSFILLPANPSRVLPLVLGMLPFVAGWGGAAGMAANVFGFDGPGFRRYFLAPTSSSSVLRGASLVPLCLGALLIPIALVCCRIMFASPAHWAVWAMLVSSALAGLFFFNGLAVWTSILLPGMSDVTAAFSRDVAGSKVLIFALPVPFILSLMIGEKLGPVALARFWWVLPVMAFAAVCFYLVTVGVGGRVLNARRERILTMVEGGY